MRKWQKAVVAVVLILVLALGAVAVLAQDDAPVPPGPGYGPGYGPGMGRGTQPGYGHMGPGMGFGRGGHMMGGFGLLETVADALDMSLDDLWAELSTGISIADLAAEKGVDVQDIIDAALDEHEAYLDELVADGYLTAEQAAWMQEHMAEMLAWRINQPWGTGMMGPGYGHMGPGMGPGFNRGGRFGTQPPAPGGDA